MSTRTALTQHTHLGPVVAAVLATILLWTSSAHADGSARWAVEWGKLGDVIREMPASFLPVGTHRSVLERPEPIADEPTRKQPFRLALSLVARDWGGAQLLVGHLSLIDQLRLIQSSRMFVTRVRVGEGAIVPFAHLGLGQWRVDTELMPSLPRDVEVAAQFGAGFEIAFSRGIALAVEADHTYLIRDQHQPQMVSTPHLWGASLAAKAVF
jgi:hypothetical protein